MLVKSLNGPRRHWWKEEFISFRRSSENVKASSAIFHENLSAFGNIMALRSNKRIIRDSRHNISSAVPSAHHARRA